MIELLDRGRSYSISEIKGNTVQLDAVERIEAGPANLVIAGAYVPIAHHGCDGTDGAIRFEMAAKKGNRGYVVSASLLKSLQDELDELGVAWTVVEAPSALGEYPRRVYVSDKEVPNGWTSYGSCPHCHRPKGLDANGHVCGGCRTCAIAEQQKNAALRDGRAMRSEALWRVIEASTPHSALDLPGWFDPGVGIRTIGDVREALKSRTLPNVGPEREMAVSQALADFRLRAIESLNGGDY